MAVTKEYVEALLESAGINYIGDFEDSPAGPVIGLSTATSHYTDSDGEKGLRILIALEEDGEYIKILAPRAYKASGPTRNAVLQACMSIQMRTKLIQFEWDQIDGEIRPVVEFAIEDSSLTERQLMRSLGGLVGLLDTYHNVISYAAESGEVDMSLVND